MFQIFCLKNQGIKQPKADFILFCSLLITSNHQKLIHLCIYPSHYKLNYTQFEPKVDYFIYHIIGLQCTISNFQGDSCILEQISLISVLFILCWLVWFATIITIERSSTIAMMITTILNGCVFLVLTLPGPVKAYPWWIFIVLSRHTFEAANEV